MVCALLVGCGSKTDNSASGSASGNTSGNASSDVSGNADMSGVKVGVVYLGDESDQGYTAAHAAGTAKMMSDLGLDDSQVVEKFNVAEDAECEAAITDLVAAGCNIIFTTSFGFQDYAQAAAAEYPDVEFCQATGDTARDAGLSNFHNYFGDVYQARYLAGIIAGLTTETNLIGYVAAQPYAEVISGYDAYYLGAKSVNPDVEMAVMYVNSWYDPDTEGQVATALIKKGCDVLSLQADSTATAKACESEGAYCIGYNSDMSTAAPDTVLTSVVWDWSIYMEYAVNCKASGETIDTDWTAGLADGVNSLVYGDGEYNTSVVSEDTWSKVEEARDAIISGNLDVFAGPLTDNEGNEVVKDGDVYVEQYSAPSFDSILEGITVY